MIAPLEDKKRGRSRLFRTDVSTSLAQQPLDKSAAEGRLSLERGAFNISPWAYGLGFIGAILALLFAFSAAMDARRAGQTREQSNPMPSATGQRAPAPSWIEVEVE
jgi:hypothetical protein